MDSTLALEWSYFTDGAVQDDDVQVARGVLAILETADIAKVPPLVPVILPGGGGYLMGDAIENRTGIGSAIGDWVGTRLGSPEVGRKMAAR